MWGARSGRTIVLSAAWAAFVILCLLPSLYMGWAVLRVPDPIAVLRHALLDVRQQRLIATTMALGLGASVLATIIGGIFGIVLARVPLPFKSALRIALAAPAVLPPYVIALAWTSIGGNLAFTVGGAVLVLATSFYPLAMLAAEVGFRRVDARLEEAALLVTSPVLVLRRISWPLARPTVISAALVIFVLAITEFSVPGLLRVPVFTTEVFSAFAALYDFGRATVLSLPLLIASAIVAAIAAVGLGNLMVTTRRPTHGAAVDAFDGWRTAAVVAISVAILALVVAPLASLARDALRSTSIGAVLWSSREAVINSLVLAFAGAIAVTALGGVLGYARARAPATAGAVFDMAWVVLFTVPSTVVGIGLIGVWNRGGLWGTLYGTPAMLILVYLARFVPVAALVVAATVRSVPESHEEAAATAGAGWLRTMTLIVLPQIGSGLLAVWILAFILAFGELGASILVAPPGESTLPIRVYTLTANAPPGHVAALALFQSAVVLCPLVLLGVVVARREAR